MQPIIRISVCVDDIKEFSYIIEYRSLIFLDIANQIFNLPLQKVEVLEYKIEKSILLSQLEYYILTELTKRSTDSLKKHQMYEIYSNSLNKRLLLPINKSPLRDAFDDMVYLCNFVFFWNTKTFTVKIIY